MSISYKQIKGTEMKTATKRIDITDDYCLLPGHFLQRRTIYAVGHTGVNKTNDQQIYPDETGTTGVSAPARLLWAT